jgi:hypothetical protein
MSRPFLAEEFLERKRKGEKPTLREYRDRHPDLTAEIGELFPALLLMEDLGERPASLPAAHVPARSTPASLPPLSDGRLTRIGITPTLHRRDACVRMPIQGLSS